jgi:UDP-N-acetylglucosamine 3-dehydrogenase
MTRFALIGAGVMGLNHARVLSKLSGADFVAVFDSSSFDIGLPDFVTIVPHISELASLGVEAAVVATPTSTHESVSLELASLGISVLVEKPVAESVSSAENMMRVFDQKNLVGAVGHIERFNPAVRELRRRLALGDIGEVFQIATRRQGSFPRRIADVGVAKDLASHDIDVVSWITGSRYARIHSELSFKSGRMHEDMLIAIGRLANGVMVSHIVNWLSPMKERVIMVTGDLGTFVADMVTGDLTLHNNGAEEISWESFAAFRGVTEGDVTKFAFPKKEPLVAELEGFRDAVAGTGGDYVSFGEGRDVLQVASAILDSAASGLPVMFDL